MRPWLNALAVAVTAALVGADTPPSAPPWQRLLQGDDARKAGEIGGRLSALQARGKFEEALEAAQALAELRQRVQGKDHWEAVNAHWQVEAIRSVLRQDDKTRQKYTRVTSLQGKADALVARGRYQEARPLLEEVLAIRREVLGEEHPDTASSRNLVAHNLFQQGKYREADEGFRKALDLRRQALAEEHPDTAGSYNNVAANLNAQGKYAAAEVGFKKALAIHRRLFGEEHADTGQSYNNVAANLNAQGKYREAEEGFRKALAIKQKTLGENHAATAQSRNNLAANLLYQGKFREAEEGFRKALAVYRKVLGENHPETTNAYHNLAEALNHQGRYREAEEFFRKGLEIRSKVFGEEHPAVAISYSGVADNLQLQGKFREGEEGFRKALDIWRKTLGEDHPNTAHGYNNLAYNLEMQGKYREAEALYRTALDIRRKVLGDEHPITAGSYVNIASNLRAQGKFRAAEEGSRKALEIYRKVHGEDHPLTALTSNNVATCLSDQGKYREAEEVFRKALATCRKVLGEEHPDTAGRYNNLAGSLQMQGRYQEAQENFQKALAIRRKALGDDHPDTASTCKELGINLHAQGKYREAEEFFIRSADAFLAARLHVAASGLGRAARTSELSPLPGLAALLARNGKPADAWQRLEQGLGRGVWDDLSTRLRQKPADRDHHAELLRRLQHLDQQLQALAAVKAPSAEQQRRREELLGDRLQVQADLIVFVHQLEKDYGPVAGQVFDRDRIQAALLEDTALLAWVDVDPAGPKSADSDGEHWAVLLRHSRSPIWERLPGSGPGGSWTDADNALSRQLRQAVQKPHRDWQPLAKQLRSQRLAPLSKHLSGVRHLVVLPSPAVAGIPIELIADGYTVSYAHSGTLYAHLRTLPKVKSAGLFALADPVFDVATATVKEKPLPPGGVLLTVVQPGSNAAKARLRPGDVLLTYDGKPLSVPADLAPLIAAAAEEKSVTVTVWREDEEKPLRLEVAPGKLGVVLASKTVPDAISDQRRIERSLASRGDDDWPELPGTRAEVGAVTHLFGNSPPPLVLTASDASEQRLHALAKSGELKKYRYLHLATHGEVDDAFPLRSAVILSRDALPDPQKQLLAGEPVFDGRLTAEEVLQQWDLDCDLVTLSACQTALGKYEKGEGFVGFAQALVLCGSRSVCLSLWKVDDAATALLM
jgi:tetratricopeptide (TPR) repeat protein